MMYKVLISMVMFIQVVIYTCVMCMMTNGDRAPILVLFILAVNWNNACFHWKCCLPLCLSVYACLVHFFHCIKLLVYHTMIFFSYFSNHIYVHFVIASVHKPFLWLALKTCFIWLRIYRWHKSILSELLVNERERMIEKIRASF